MNKIIDDSGQKVILEVHKENTKQGWYLGSF